MSTDARITQLLLHYEELHEQGRTISLKDLCRDCPELLEPVKQEIRALQRVDQQGNSTQARPNPTPLEGWLDLLAPAQGPGEIGRLGVYRLLKVLGSGGMGIVCEAEDTTLHRPVALKLMQPRLAANNTHRQRFLREARAAAALKHDHVVTIYQVGEDRGVPFLAMEFLRGESLEDRIKRQGKLPLPEVLRIGHEIALGLAAAHEQGLIHRDIKPANLWLEMKVEGGRMKDEKNDPHSASSFLNHPTSFRLKILDFGLARATNESGQLTQVGTVLGTPAYMAPEQARGQAVDHRCDLYSLGCVLYQMTTGSKVFPGKAVTVLTALVMEEPKSPRQLNPDLPPALADLIVQLLAKDPGQRPSSARAVAETLQSLEHQLKPTPSLRPWWIALSCAAALFLLVGWFALTPSKGTIQIEVGDPTAIVTLDGIVIPRDKLAQPLTLRKGVHELVLKRDDGEIVTRTSFLLEAGPNPSLRIEPPKKLAKEPDKVDKEPRAPTPRDLQGLALVTDLDFSKDRIARGDHKDATWGPKDNQHQILAKHGGVWVSEGVTPPLPYFIAELEGRLAEPGKGGWGLGFEGDIPKHAWPAVQVGSDRKVRLYQYKEGNGARTAWTSAAAMRPITELNLLRVEVLGKKIRIFVNQKHVLDAENPEPRAGSVFFLVHADGGARVDARFQGIRVWGIPAPGSLLARTGNFKELAMREFGSTKETEAAVARGLQWVVRQQSPDGKWMLENPAFLKEIGRPNDTAGTAFGLLPLLGAGFTHKASPANPYDKNIEKGLLFLISRQDKKTGNLQGGMYTQALGTIVLCEAYGLTKDDTLRSPAQLAVDYIVQAQHEAGGWRYSPGQAGDTDVTGWQLMALKTAQVAGLDIPELTLQKAMRFLDSNCSPADEGYGYFGPDASPRMTVVGLLFRQHFQAWGPEHPRLQKGITNHLEKMQPGAAKDLYGLYYATQVMHQAGGPGWKTWNAKMRDHLLNTQELAPEANHGSWSSAADPFCSHGGRLMATSLALLNLEVYYRHFPLHYRPGIEKVPAQEPKKVEKVEKAIDEPRPPRPRDILDNILDEINLIPPVRTSEGKIDRGNLPAFAPADLEPYKGDYRSLDELKKMIEAKPEQFALRAAILKAAIALEASHKFVMEERLQGFPGARQMDVKVKTVFMNKQKEPGIMIFELDRALGDLKEAGAKRLEEPSRRWQAHYDYCMARLQSRLVFIYEYNFILSQVRSDSLPALDQLQTCWRIGPRQIVQVTETKIKKMVGEINRTWEQIAKDYPGTPWAVLARREQVVPLGLEWRPSRD